MQIEVPDTPPKARAEKGNQRCDYAGLHPAQLATLKTNSLDLAEYPSPASWNVVGGWVNVIHAPM